jgi:hypothetical protein
MLEIHKLTYGTTYQVLKLLNGSTVLLTMKKVCRNMWSEVEKLLNKF